MNVPVTILDAWDSEGDYYTNGANFTVSSGTNRVAIVMISAEKNGSGPIDVNYVTLGGQTLTEIHGITVGSSTAYHNLLWMGYLNEAGISSMSGNTIAVNWNNNPDPGPFGNSKMHWASYQDVDQANIDSASSSATNTSTSSLAPGQIDVAVDEKCVVMVVGGQPNAPGPATGYTEETEEIGPGNDHSSSSNHRTATTADATHNPTFTLASSTRMAVGIIALGYAPALTPKGFSDDGSGADVFAKIISLLSKDFVDSGSGAEVFVKTSYELEGVTYDKDGDVLGSCDCYLWKDNGDNTITFKAHVVSDAGTGEYTFAGIADDDSSYLVVFIKDDSPHVFDVTDHNLTPLEG